MSHQPPFDAASIRDQATALAAHLQRAGVQWLPKPRPEIVTELSDQMEGLVEDRVDSATASAELVQPVPEKSAPEESAPEKSAPTSQPVATGSLIADLNQSYPGDDLDTEQRSERLASLEASVAICRRCEILASCRKQTVFGEGSPRPRFVFFGEGPGADEDRTGRPFVGRAGQLLTKMIEACTLQREDTYILNTIKCRPPGNRNPEPEEIQNCREYYEQQLTILRPEYIVCLGAISSQELLQTKSSVGRLRGKLHRYFDSKVLVTYHPAYLLRNPAAKKAAWEDLQLMLRDAGIQLR